MLYDEKKWARPKVNQVAVDLHAAADWIEEKGWCRYRSEWGQKRCITGALVEVTGMADFKQPFHDFLKSMGRLDRAVRHFISMTGHVPTVWNDNICKSGKHAVAMMRAMADV